MPSTPLLHVHAWERPLSGIARCDAGAGEDGPGLRRDAQALCKVIAITTSVRGRLDVVEAMTLRNTVAGPCHGLMRHLTVAETPE
jgi:hypothetical protein